MITQVKIPAVNANEDSVLLVKWHCESGAPVTRGQMICEVETSKASLEIEADGDGHLVVIAEAGGRYALGATIGLLKSNPSEDHAAFLSSLEAASRSAAGPTTERRWTKKAFIAARRLGIDIEELSAKVGGRVVGEEDVLAAQRDAVGHTGEKLSPLVPDDPAIERVLLIGGGAGAGSIAMDSIARTPKQMAVAILDGNPRTHGTIHEGVPILGSVELINELWAQKAFDGVVILFTDDVDERAAHFDRLKAGGIPFTNVIDPSVSIRAGVRFGTGNVVMANCFFAAGTEVGDNCFFASHTVIEHHSKIGSHCTFGPRTTTSGKVTIGDRVKTGMNVAIEPYLTVGEHSLIASGIVLTSSVPARTVVKAKQTHLSRTQN